MLILTLYYILLSGNIKIQWLCSFQLFWEKRPYGVVASELDLDIAVSKFKRQSRIPFLF